jgi:hypothetical protein
VGKPKFILLSPVQLPMPIETFIAIITGKEIDNQPAPWLSRQFA